MRRLRLILRHVAGRVVGGVTAGETVDIAAQEEAAPGKEIVLEPLHPDFGARLHNVDLEDLSDAQWDVVQEAFDERIGRSRYGVIVIPDQGDSLDPKALTDFARRFHREDPTEIGLPEEVGPLYGKKPSGQGGFGGSQVPKHPEIGILGVNAGAMGITDSTGIGIEWHIDSAPGGGNVRKKLKDGTEVKSTVTLGCATIIYSVMAPEQGGETLFAHGGVLYDLLDEDLQKKAEEAVVRYRGRAGKLEDAVMGEGGTKIVDDDKITTRLPLVRTHPSTGRKCIWATPRFMESVENLSVADSRELVSQCMQPGTAPEHVYVHKYSVGDIVVWDDRHCFHSTSPIKVKEDRYGSGGVVGRRIIQRIGSSTAAAYKWGSTEDEDDKDDDEKKESTEGEDEDKAKATTSTGEQAKSVVESSTSSQSAEP